MEIWFDGIALVIAMRDERSENSKMMSDSEHDSGKNIVPCMRDHAGPQRAPQNGEDAEERAIHADGDHADSAFVSMRDAEEERRGEDSDPKRICGRSELAQQITAKRELFD
jgi:hypothetical protein